MSRVGVVGLGYVGLPLVVALAEAGLDVVALDNDASKVDSLRRGESYVEDVPTGALRAVRERIQPTTRYAALAEVDAIVLCVPTPLTQNREPDLAALVGAASAVADVMQAGQLVVLESTTYPGTTRDRLVPILEESGMKAGRDFHVAFSPERVDPGRTAHTMRTTPKVVGGLTGAGGERAEELYGRICDEIVRVGTPEAAEMTKLLENIFRSVNIALVNELSILCERMVIDVWEVVDAATTKPLRVHALRSRPRHGRPLPARRPVLPNLEGTRVRPGHRVHRAGGKGQRADADALHSPHRAGAQRGA